MQPLGIHAHSVPDQAGGLQNDSPSEQMAQGSRQQAKRPSNSAEPWRPYFLRNDAASAEERRHGAGNSNRAALQGHCPACSRHHNCASSRGAGRAQRLPPMASMGTTWQERCHLPRHGVGASEQAQARTLARRAQQSGQQSARRRPAQAAVVCRSLLCWCHDS